MLFDQQFSEIMEEELGGRSTRAICPLDFEFELTDFTSEETAQGTDFSVR